MATTIVTIERSNKNMPCLWECGGKYNGNGKVQLITTSDGAKKKSIFVRRSGDLACKNHALIPIMIGDFTITALLDGTEVTAELSAIKRIDLKDATIQTTSMFTGILTKDGNIEGTWYPDVPAAFKPAIAAAFNKLQDYHCRSVYYANVPVYKDETPQKVDLQVGACPWDTGMDDGLAERE